MKIGKNINTENKKKVYRKPVVEVVEVDNVILLQAGNSTVPGEPGTGGIDGPKVQSFPETENTTNPQPPSKSSNPFGGGTPDFER